MRLYACNVSRLSVLGTPGTGKSTLAGELAQRTGLAYHNIGDVAKENEFYDGYDDQLDCPILDDEKVDITFPHKYLMVDDSLF